MSTAPDSQHTDSWDAPSTSASASSRRNLSSRSVEPVPDDWDASSSSDEDGTEEAQRKIWDEANQKAPMPELVMSSSSISAPLPAAAFNGPIRILKRPQASQAGSHNTSSSTSNTSETLAEKQARYQLARERIFGSDKPISPPPTSSPSPQPQASVVPTSIVMRNPYGPAPTDQGPSGMTSEAIRGFDRRRTNKPPAPQCSSGMYLVTPYHRPLYSFLLFQHRRGPYLPEYGGKIFSKKCQQLEN